MYRELNARDPELDKSQVTYSTDSRNPHLLRYLLPSFQIRLTNSVKLKLLTFRHRSLQSYPRESIKITGIAKSGEHLSYTCISLDLKGERYVVFTVGLVDGWV